MVIKKPFMLRNRKDVIEFLWYNSFRDDRPFKENAAYLLKNGWYVILPNVTAIDIKIYLHYERYLGSNSMYFNGQQIEAVIHTHPGGVNTTYLDADDSDFLLKHPDVTLFTIVKSVVYEIWERTYLPTETVAH